MRRERPGRKPSARPPSARAVKWFLSCIACRETVDHADKNQAHWTRMTILNDVARCGKFSSDRSIRDPRAWI
ncbi:MAG: glycogen/starch/alpha-glucan phosphorylase [Gammaproteobacteria bacterium]